MEDKEKDAVTQADTMPPADPIVHLINKGIDTFNEYNKRKEDNVKELRKTELKTIDKLDFRDKMFKIIAVLACLIVMFLFIFLETKTDAALPVITLILGLVLGSDSLNGFYSFRSRKRKYTDYEEVE